jgi:elongation factor G
VYGGSMTTDGSALNTRTGKDERLAQLHHMVGSETKAVKQITAGDIVAITKLKDTGLSDTLSDSSRPVAVVPPTAPSPMISYVLRPKTRADEDKLRGALQKIRSEDPVLEQTFDPTTKEVVLAGMGANHIALSMEKMSRKYGANVDLGTPTIPYRETIAGNADVRYRHKKQTGGAGQFGEVAIKIGPNKGEGFVFEDKTVGGVIPNTLIPSVEKGVRAQLSAGILAGFPTIDVKVTLYDGKSHPVDSKDIAFQIAGRQAIKQAVMKARPILLEPVYDVEVTVPEAMVGDIMGDMNTRRARIKSMDSKGRNNIVKATVPLAEMLTYPPALKSMTGGQGVYIMNFASYEPVPHAMQDDLVAKVSRVSGGDDDD